jgi:flavin reductase (DIM6/NTAB) family NADH-FMN oxidoreductase RutF
MFYETSKNDHGLPRDPFKAIVAPRPIGWITSMSADGQINLAPYSFFNGVSSEPPIVMFSGEGYKDSISFILETREFVCNVPNYDLREAVVKTSADLPRGVNEMNVAQLKAAPTRLVRPPRVAAAPCAMECWLLNVVTLQDLDGNAVDRHVQERPPGHRGDEADRALRLRGLCGGGRGVRHCATRRRRRTQTAYVGDRLTHVPAKWVPVRR